MALASRRPLFSLSVFFCLPHQTFVSVFLLFNAHTKNTTIVAVCDFDLTGSLPCRPTTANFSYYCSK